MFNNDAEYAKSRIVGSYMRGKTQLYKIIDIVSRDNVLDKSVILALDQDKNSVQLKIKELEFSFGKLGYVNDVNSGIASFISRLPLRRDYRQGLRAYQLISYRGGGTGSITESWLEQNTKSVYKCLNNIFPKLEKVIELSEEYNGDIAFSKNFALSSKYKLLYRGFVIGDLNKDDKFKLNHSFNFVEEEFVKEVGHDNLSR
jgi:hypothetical protein